MQKKFSIIVAIAQNSAIGKNNQLLWHISDDLKRFKEITLDKTVIMGKNTYLSLPYRPLKNRTNIVITDNKEDNFEGCTTVYSIAQKLYITHVQKSFDADTYFPEILKEEWTVASEDELMHDEKSNLDYRYVNYTRKQAK